jgi:hypothetical protein
MTRTLYCYGCQCLVLLGAFTLRTLLLAPLTRLLTFVAQQRTQLVARQLKQHRYFNARQTRLKLPFRPLQHRQILSSAEPYLRYHVVWRCVVAVGPFPFCQATDGTM